MVVSPDDVEIRPLLEAIYVRFHHDFRKYAMASLRRRIGAAMATLKCKSVPELQEKMLTEPALFSVLMQHLTVQVSEMFRDPRYFAVLRDRIVPELRTYPSLKIWVPGCSSGEEVYSIAILLREEGLLDRTVIYATDINGVALAKAEAATYPLDRIDGFRESYLASGGQGSLSRYYAESCGSAVFDKTLRAKIVFSDHSLATDNVFAEVQLVSCRNVLMYFDHEQQDRAVGLFKDALCRRGFLGLGSRESVRFSGYASLFLDVAPTERWYQRC